MAEVSSMSGGCAILCSFVTVEKNHTVPGPRHFVISRSQAHDVTLPSLHTRNFTPSPGDLIPSQPRLWFFWQAFKGEVIRWADGYMGHVPQLF